MNINVGPQDSKKRLDLYLTNWLSTSRGQIQRQIKEGRIKVNGKTVKPHYRIKEGDLIEIEPQEKKEATILPEPMPLDILYEDEDILVVNKPPHIVVHPTPSITKNTLLQGILHYTPLSSIGLPFRPGVVHRLDKNTSGVLVFAKNDLAYLSLSKQFRERLIKKVYIALVEGNIKQNQGEINIPIGYRHKKGGIKRAVRGRLSRQAITRFNVLRRYKNHTLLELFLETGRTHQIRIHLAYIGHPVVGDTLYGRKDQKFTYHALHASILGLYHPRTQHYIEFIAPLPEDFKNLLKNVDYL